MSQLATVAPAGTHFEFSEVKTARGTKSLGERPCLVFDTEEGVKAHFNTKLVDVLNSSNSPTVAYQSIARRLAIAGKSDDEIAEAQLKWMPGERAVGASTPVSRAAKAAKNAADKVDGDKIAAFLQQVADGKISEEDLSAFLA